MRPRAPGGKPGAERERTLSRNAGKRSTSLVPRVVVSMGDPTGIGPEVTLKALAKRGTRRGVETILIGDLGVYEETASRLGLSLNFLPWAPPDPIPRRGLPVMLISNLRSSERRLRHPSVAGGRAAYTAILDAFQLIRIGLADALVTAPICKANLVAAGADMPGHTELLAGLAGGVDVRMMMVGKTLRVALVTTHMAISRVPQAISVKSVLDTITITNDTMRTHYRIAKPRIAVLGLNPHAGEEGLFGDEERRVIEPAIRKASRGGIRASGPFPADGLFPHAVAGKYDAVVCMYHDQGLAPFKLLHFADGVNFTAGLPFIRTSPDHGTAHDIAGRGIADPGSMIAALSLAADLCHKKSGQSK